MFIAVSGKEGGSVAGKDIECSRHCVGTFEATYTVGCHVNQHIVLVSLLYYIVIVEEIAGAGIVLVPFPGHVDPETPGIVEK